VIAAVIGIPVTIGFIVKYVIKCLLERPFAHAVLFNQAFGLLLVPRSLGVHNRHTSEPFDLVVVLQRGDAKIRGCDACE
jgi:hypothetical protein